MTELADMPDAVKTPSNETRFYEVLGLTEKFSFLAAAHRVQCCHQHKLTKLPWLLIQFNEVFPEMSKNVAISFSF